MTATTTAIFQVIHPLGIDFTSSSEIAHSIGKAKKYNWLIIRYEYLDDEEGKTFVKYLTANRGNNPQKVLKDWQKRVLQSEVARGAGVHWGKEWMTRNLYRIFKEAREGKEGSDEDLKHMLDVFMGKGKK
ncbi:uncharacterized protein J4E84_003303 [Alternaria hordeiaustralica]|uniref:uncharacterized protein n=1 Tax=Alternaria hordeiaustralica TaxID=1187925 RepID=UPI0020C5448A|nr:uncharacterized protein J4E84_003303 [Alternaria hordeiaustralica]KAI4692333.1 hypothetical protein J4E84_003303 [Alternaria hordeiaustralica]